MSSSTAPSAAGVYEYQTLASVAGAPHCVLASMSSASVVAWLVSSVTLNGNEVIATDPANVSLLGAAARAGAAVAVKRVSMTAKTKLSRRTRDLLPGVRGLPVQALAP